MMEKLIEAAANDSEAAEAMNEICERVSEKGDFGHWRIKNESLDEIMFAGMSGSREAVRRSPTPRDTRSRQPAKRESYQSYYERDSPENYMG